MITDIFDKALELESGRLLLRPVIEDDADALFEIFSDQEVMQYYDILPLKNKDEARELCDRFMKTAKRNSVMNLDVIAGAWDLCPKLSVLSCALFMKTAI